LEEPDPIDEFPINSKVCRFDLLSFSIGAFLDLLS